MGLRHLTAATLPDDPSKEVSTGEWNEDHKFTEANIGALLVRGASSDLVAGVSSVASGQVLVSQGAGSLPAWNSTPTLSGLTLGGHLTFSGAFNVGDGAGSSPPFVYAETAISVGTNAASTGAIRLANDTAIYGRNAANSANIRLMIVGGDDNIYLGEGAGIFILQAPLNLSGGLDLTGVITLHENADPGNAPADRAYLFIKDNGSGKSQIAVRFPTGAVQILSTEP